MSFLSALGDPSIVNEIGIEQGLEHAMRKRGNGSSIVFRKKDQAWQRRFVGVVVVYSSVVLIPMHDIKQVFMGNPLITAKHVVPVQGGQQDLGIIVIVRIHDEGREGHDLIAQAKLEETFSVGQGSLVRIGHGQSSKFLFIRLLLLVVVAVVVVSLDGGF